MSAVKTQSLPQDIWLPTGNTTHSRSGLAAAAAARFSLPLDSLDVASTSPSSKSTLPLTPPLTPASIRATTTVNSDSNSIIEGNTHTRQNWNPNHNAATSPRHNTSFQDASSQDTALPSPTSPLDFLKTAATLMPMHPQEHHTVSRFLIVSGIPKTTDSQSLKQTFMACGELKGIFVRFHREHGIIILAFFDLRHSIRAHRQISTSPLFNGIRLHPRFISPSELRAWIGESNFVNQNEGELFITVSLVGPNTDFSPAALQNILASFGDLQYFRCSSVNGNSFHVEYFDARDGASALNALNGRAIHGARLHINLQDTSTAAPSVVSFAPATPPGTVVDSRIFAFPSNFNSRKHEAFSDIPFPSKEAQSDEGNRQPLQHLSSTSRPTLHHSISEQNIRGRPRSRSASASPSPARQEEQHQSILSAYDYFNNHQHFPHEDAVSNHPRVRTPPHHVHGRRISNIYHFDSVGRTMLELPPTAPPRPRSISVSSETDSPVAGRLAIPLPASPMTKLQPELTTVPDVKREHSLDLSSQWPTSELPFTTGSPVVSSPRRPALQLQIPRRHLVSRHQHSGSNGALGFEFSGEKEKDTQPERNKIDISKIERGEETRTTVMIKNIPNKMTDRNLIEFINEVCPRKIDFLYLRMDFTNGCNVGYAFVNFIHVQDLLHFAKTKLGTKWNLFSSEKVLGMSYANLCPVFLWNVLRIPNSEPGVKRHSSTNSAPARLLTYVTQMDQREAWRPKLFHSSGRHQGLAEEFPAPTHTRRKERSSLLPHDLHQSRTLFHHTSTSLHN